MTNPNHIQNPESTDVIRVDLIKWLYKLLSYWWLFVLCLGIAWGCGYLFLRYATYEYSASAILLIDNSSSNGGVSSEQILSERGIFGGGKSLDNEIQILKSLTLMEKVVEALDMQVSYYREGVIKQRELYKVSPIKLDSFKLAGKRDFGCSLFIEMSEGSNFKLKFKPEGEGQTKYYGEPFECRFGEFTISIDSANYIGPGLYRIDVRPVESVAWKYKGRLNIQRVGDSFTSDVLELSLRDEVPQKAADIINALIDVYNKEEIRQKNKVLRNTLDFIDERVKILNFELDSVESRIERYKSRNTIITDNAASSMSFALNETRTIIQEITDLNVRKNVLESLENILISDKQTFDLLPFNLLSDNVVLSSLVNQYNGLVLQWEQLKTKASIQNPARISLESQLIDIRNLILETIRNLQRDIQIPLKQLDKDLKELQASMSNVPTLEKTLLEQKRAQAIKESLFLFLLTTREETALSEAVTTANTRTIERARTAKFPVFPKRKMVYMACTILGLVVPILFVMIRSFFETKIDSIDDLKQMTSIPILGRIAQNKGKEHVVVRSGDRSAVNEMFRQLRTNLDFLNLKNQHQVLMVTSSVSGEGKSFVALNLAIALALSNKKVILLGMDLRKPKLSKYIGKEDFPYGIVNYLIGQKDLSELIQKYEGSENLSFIGSGPIPPNPTELIHSEKLEQLITALTAEYDYVMIDTPPIGLVSDALLLRKMVSQILVVVRHKYTQKGMVKDLEEMYQNGELANAGIVLNGIKKTRGYYGYHQKYGQGYYQ